MTMQLEMIWIVCGERKGGYQVPIAPSQKCVFQP